MVLNHRTALVGNVQRPIRRNGLEAAEILVLAFATASSPVLQVRVRRAEPLAIEAHDAPPK